MKDRKNAFTLIEIIAVIIIIGIIVIIAVPSVQNYINSASDTTFLSYEHTMEEAAKNHVVKCTEDSDVNCNLPDVEEARKVYLSELINDGYLELLKSPLDGQFCESDISYVEISKNNNNSFRYNACLYCREYKSSNSVCKEYSLDNDDPVCGNVTGESTRWTNQNRTISVVCSDKTSGCRLSSFSKTFNTSVKEGVVTIADNSGRTKDCPVNVYIDKAAPTC